MRRSAKTAFCCGNPCSRKCHPISKGERLVLLGTEPQFRFRQRLAKRRHRYPFPGPPNLALLPRLRSMSSRRFNRLSRSVAGFSAVGSIAREMASST